ncbi:assembly protein in type IV pilin biogenesis transmembrane protein [Gammaproteobacteria bacterium]|nr:assembly protein in type IV pilin biogenesis transmembrane protein [Gammaproteobacteria bacterium]
MASVYKKKKQIKREFNFEWKGRDKNGKLVNNIMRGSSQAEVRVELIKQGIQPLSMRQIKNQRGSGGSVNTKDIMLFSRQMATMLQAGIAISESLSMQAAGLKKLTMRNLLLKIKLEIDSGNNFANALGYFPDVFSEMYRGLVTSGEESGTLETVFKQLADYLERVEKIKSTVKKAMVYPLSVITLALGITVVILLYVIPVFQDMFESAGMELPGLTQFVVDMSNALRTWTALFIVISVIVGIIIFNRTVMKTESVKNFIAKKILSVPLFGNLIILSNCAAFSRTLGTMYLAGTPMISALTTVSGACGNKVFKEAVLNIRGNVAIGQQLNFAMAQTRLFPEMVVHMVGIGEKSGNLSDMLFKVSEFFEEEVEATVATMMVMIEPILIVVLGVLIGGLVAAMYLPIFDMASAA